MTVRNDYNPNGAAQDIKETDNTVRKSVGGSIGIDIYDDLYVINSNDESNLFKGGLF